MSQIAEVPVVTLRDMVVYPHGVQPLFIGTPKSISALEAAQAGAGDKRILLLAKMEPENNDPTTKDLYRYGTTATILQLIRLPDKTVKILVEGESRAKVSALRDSEAHFVADIELISEEVLPEAEAAALCDTLMKTFESYVNASKKIPAEVVTSVSGITQPSRLVDTIAAQLNLSLKEKQTLLETAKVQARIKRMSALLSGEIEVSGVDKKIRGRVKKQMEKSQREYYLNEQMKAIQKELGDLDEGPTEIEQLQERVEASGMPAEAKDKVDAEIKKLKMMSPMSAEATVVRSYLDWMLNTPWKKRSRVKTNISAAEQILNEDHYGLDDVKERILEFLAVQKRVKKNKGPVLCLVGPPGVGKTSLGESIAKSVNRKYVRMALGGVRDEAEIRGHRRTYIGAMPGSIVQKMQKVNVKNPLFLLDEIDKMASDFRGDPSSAMLEVLDPEQNHTFNDHYLEVDYDLSQVMFVATANSLNLPEALIDRMEIIQLSGYTEDEKLEIAKRHLIAKQMKNNGIKSSEIVFKDSAIMDIIRYYTREAGVRNLDREIGSICRKVIKDVTLKKRKTKAIINSKSLPKFLGMKKFRFGLAEEHNQIGEVTGLAWTSVGGDLLTIEASSYKGKGKLNYTGQLGDVMKESIQAAMSVTRLRADSLGISDDFHEKLDIHIHVPDGSTPKDGPSAGAAMCTALVSVLTGRKVKAAVAMTGEITLRGEITPIGGLKEKLLAAMRGGIQTVIIPEDNERELSEVPEKIKSKLEIIKVKWIDQVLDIALEKE